MHVIIPAAGYGTRLHPLTKKTPKALLTVARKPLLYFILKKIDYLNSKYEGLIKKIVIVSNDYYFRAFQEWLEKNKPMDIEVVLLNDGTKNNEERLGTIGDVVFALEELKIHDDVLIINSDNIFDFSLEPLIQEFEKTGKSCIALHDVKTLKRAKKYGIVKTDRSGWIKEFYEKPEKPESTLASIGMYLYPKDILHSIEEFYSKYGIKADKSGNFVEWIIKKEKVFGVTFKAKWFDIGSKKELEQARKIFSSEKKILRKIKE